MRYARGIAVGVLLATAGVASGTVGSPGTYDETFGGTGVVLVADGPSDVNSAEAVCVASDGSVVMAATRSRLTIDGRNGTAWVVVKRLADGSADAGFGSG